MNFIALKNKKINEVRVQAAQTQQHTMALLQQQQSQVSISPYISSMGLPSLIRISSLDDDDDVIPDRWPSFRMPLVVAVLWVLVLATVYQIPTSTCSTPTNKGAPMCKSHVSLMSR